MKKELLKITVVVCLTLLLMAIADLFVGFGLAENRAECLVIFLTAAVILQRLDFEESVMHFARFGVRLIEATQADIESRFANRD